jgi:ribulose 1,5-bisphosphate synthetase/thiazole synthase
MDEDDINAVIDAFGDAAANSMAGGFDGVEVKVAHDGLLRSFASPHFNRRTDRWGGSFANRMQLPIQVLRRVRERIGMDPALGVRLCISEFTDWGYDVEYGLRMAEALEATALLSYINCDHGSYSSTWYEIPPFVVPQGFFRPLNAALKRHSDLPVIASGRIRHPELAEEILADGEADLIGMARQLIADARWAEKAQSGRSDEIRLCIACNDACVVQTAQGKPIRCVVNPRAGREAEPRARVPRGSGHVVVVGGGPAGLRAAETLAQSTRVTLLETESELGGLVALAGRQPLHEEILDAVHYLVGAIRRAGVEVQLEVEANATIIDSFEPDAIVIATGSEANLPHRPRRTNDDGRLARSLGRQVTFDWLALDAAHVRSSDECYLDDAPRDVSVLIVDGTGHWETAGTAELLAARGCRVEVCSAAPVVGAHMDEAGRVLWHARAIEQSITVSPNVELLEVVPGGARLRDLLSGRERLATVDIVVPVLARRSREDLFLELKQTAGVPVVRAGDCVSPRLLQQAIYEGDAVACTLAEAMRRHDRAA